MIRILQRSPRRPAFRQRAKRIAAWFAAGSLSVALGVVVGFYIWAPGVVKQFNAVLAQTSDNTIIFDRNDAVIATVQGVEDRHQVPLFRISPQLQKAVVGIEDRRFFGHRGMDPIRLIGAIWADLQSMAFQQGGSTITQQLVKLTLLSSERTVARKIKEIFMALALEREYTKEQILEFYLNQVYLGFGVYGVEKAAQSYFRVEASDLTLAQAALLAALIKKPEGYLTDATIEKEMVDEQEQTFLRLPPASQLIQRQHLVLTTLRQLGWVSQEDYVAALQEPLTVHRPSDETSGAPYFVQEVLKEIRERLGVARVSGRGFRVYTTLDRKMQTTAQELVSQLKEPRFSANQGALVAMDPLSGDVRALVGGVDFADSQFNRATQARRQPGSAFKPLLYAAALEQGYTPNTVFLDEPFRYTWTLEDGTEEVYEPRNYGEHYGVVRDNGEALLPLDRHMTLGRALEVSSNVVSVRLLAEMGMSPLRRLAGMMGIDIRSRMGLCVALGCSEVTLMELTSAYATFANGGLRTKPVLIRRIEERGRRIAYEHSPDLPSQVISPWTAFEINQLLQGVVQRGTGRRARLDRPVGGKTGTNDGPRDTWFVGFTPTLVAGVWTGNDDNRIMPNEAGGRTAATIWHDFMERVLEPYTGEEFPQPEDPYVAVRVCTLSGQAAGPWCPNSELYYFRSGEAPENVCTLHQGPPMAYAICADPLGPLTADCPVEQRQYRYFYANATPSDLHPVPPPGAASFAEQTGDGDLQEPVPPDESAPPLAANGPAMTPPIAAPPVSPPVTGQPPAATPGFSPGAPPPAPPIAPAGPPGISPGPPPPQPPAAEPAQRDSAYARELSDAFDREAAPPRN